MRVLLHSSSQVQQSLNQYNNTESGWTSIYLPRYHSQ